MGSSGATYQAYDGDIPNVSAFAGTLLDDADAAAVRTTLGLDGTYAPVADPLGFGFPMTVGALINGGTLSSIQSANNTWFHRVLGGGTITKIGLHVGVQAGNVVVAVYSPSGSGRAAVPGVRKATSGSVACPASGYAEVSVGGSIVVAAGDFFSLSADDVSATFRQANVGGGSSDLYAGKTYVKASSFPPADPAGSAIAAADRQFALVGVA